MNVLLIACTGSLSAATSNGVALYEWTSSAGVLLPPDASKPRMSLVSNFNFSFNASLPFSAEARATVSLPAGNYSFSLKAAGVGVLANIWVDGHLVARYAPSGIFYSGHDLGGSGRRSESVDDVLSVGEFPNAALGGGLNATTGSYDKAFVVRVWYTPLDSPAFGGHVCAKYVANGACSGQSWGPAGTSVVSLNVLYSSGTTANDTRRADMVSIPEQWIQPILPPAHQQRLTLQKSFSGWGTWLAMNKVRHRS